MSADEKKKKKEDDLDQEATDTNPETQSQYVPKKNKRIAVKTEEFFDFTNEKLNVDQLIEEGISLDDLVDMQNYYSLPAE